jgi:hypothetical protein
MNKNITYVTGIWDIGRSNISDDFKRTYTHYLDKFEELLKTDCNLFIYCSEKDNDFIWERRLKENTFVKNIEIDELRDWFAFSDKVEKIRTNERWYKYASWLKESPQAKLDMYNIIVMSKMFFINDVTHFNPFNSEYIFWIDAGIINTVSSGYFTHDMVFDHIDNYYEVEDKFLFLSFPYDGDREVHGFRKENLNIYADTYNVEYVCRGGFFGGKREHINEISSIYYHLLSNTLNDGFMGTEESVFLIITYLYPELTQRFQLESNGLVAPFFEEIKNKYKTKIKLENKKKKVKDLKTSLYVLTYNSPKQFEELCLTIMLGDEEMFNNTEKILINNSLDRSTDKLYKELCKLFGFKEIKKDNLGICGGRQFIAEHFMESDSDYMIFFEDDMFLFRQNTTVCLNGFRNYINNLFRKSLNIIHENEYDFLKLQFTELYGDNGTQWAWYNIPQDVREKYFPNKPKLPKTGIDRNAPKTKFGNIKRFEDLAYINGDIYYCNWPHLIGKKGTKKIFIDNKFDHPYEQTWMSLVFQMQKEGKINSALLLLSPINHDRFEFYSAEERKEN